MSQPPIPLRQRGIVLVVSLIFLLVLTLIAVTGMQTSSLEEKMAGNLRDRNLALQSAETALQSGEDWLGPQQTAPVPCVAGTTTTDCAWPEGDLQQAASTDPWWQDDTLWGSAQSYGSALAGVAIQPRFFREEEQFVADGLTVGFANTSANTGRQVYRTTARGTGSSPNARVVLQSTYSKRFD